MINSEIYWLQTSFPWGAEELWDKVPTVLILKIIAIYDDMKINEPPRQRQRAPVRYRRQNKLHFPASTLSDTHPSNGEWKG